MIDYEAFAKEGYTQNEIVYATIRYKTDAMAQVPLMAFTGDKFSPELADENHALSLYSDMPNMFQSMIEFLQLLVTYLDLSGNAYIFIKELSPDKVETFLLRPDRVFLVPKTDGDIMYLYIPQGHTLETSTPILPEQLIHIKYPNPFDDFEGYGFGVSPLSAVARTIDVDNLMTEFEGRFFKGQGVMPGGTIEFPNAVDDDDLIKIRDQFVSNYGGEVQWGKPILLDNDGKYRPSPMNFTDIGFDALDEKNIKRGTSVFGVPALLLGLDTSGSTFNNVAEAQDTFWTQTMFALYRLIEIKIRKRVRIDDNVWLAFDASGVPAFQDDLALQSEIYERLVRNGVSPNIASVKSGLDLPESEFGDIAFMPTDLVPIINLLNPPEDQSQAIPTTQSNDDNEELSNSPLRDIKSAIQLWKFEDKEQIAKQLDTIALSHEDQFKRVIREQFNRDREAILKIIRDNKSLAIRQKVMVNWTAINQDIDAYLKLTSQAEWREAIKPQVLSVAQNSRQEWVTRLNLADDFGTFALRNIESEAWFDAYTLQFAQDVTRTTSKDVHNIIAVSMAEGEGTDLTGNRIGKMFDQYIAGGQSPEDWAFMEERMPAHRLETIARTETHGASQAGSQGLFQLAGIRLKEWLATGDDRTRDTHIAAESRYTGNGAIPMDERFFVGDSQLLYPGDKAGSARETINCRCVSLPVVE
jgi:HK97 family phage portal protein